jgi:hypothetical protein
LKQKYDTDSTVGYIAVSGPGLQNPSMVGDDDSVFTTSNSDQLVKWNYSAASYSHAWENALTDFATILSHKPLMIAPALMMGDNSPALDFISFASSNYPGRVLFETQHLNPDFLNDGPANSSITSAFKISSNQLGRPFALQSGKMMSNGPESDAQKANNFETELKAAQTFGASWLEIYMKDLITFPALTKQYDPAFFYHCPAK